MVIKYQSAAVGDCIQIGKISYLGGQPERCTYLFDWPTSWTESAKSGQTYTASVDVSSANYQWPAGPYIVSILSFAPFVPLNFFTTNNCLIE